MRESEFEYRGNHVKVEIDEPSTESASGIFLTTITVWPIGPDGERGQAVRVCRRAQGIFLAEASAHDAAVKRAKAYIDEAAPGPP